jgi:hypothetical protein
MVLDSLLIDDYLTLTLEVLIKSPFLTWMMYMPDTKASVLITVEAPLMVSV